MSGFALIRRDVAMRLPNLRNPRAYKFLLEVLVRSRPLDVVEFPIVFRSRKNGESKLTWKDVIEFVRLLLALKVPADTNPVSVP
jgi:dolichol-phosphate mannosyltransferase